MNEVGGSGGSAKGTESAGRSDKGGGVDASKDVSKAEKSGVVKDAASTSDATAACVGKSVLDGADTFEGEVSLAKKDEVKEKAVDPAVAGNWPSGQVGVYSPGGSLADVEAGKTLGIGQKSAGVREAQKMLEARGFSLAANGGQDGMLGPATQGRIAEFQKSAGLPETGALDKATLERLREEPKPGVSTTGQPVPGSEQYTPFSKEAVSLFREAAKLAGVPESWASSPGLHHILGSESAGIVGRPNYTYGARADDPTAWGKIHEELRAGIKSAGTADPSSATGLGQLLLSNVDKYYPSGRSGIGNAVQEAAGMLSYIEDRYGTPGNAWAKYGKMGFEGY